MRGIPLPTDLSEERLILSVVVRHTVNVFYTLRLQYEYIMVKAPTVNCHGFLF